MVEVNVAAVATGAFLGLLALVAAVACMPPILRFLGDLCCCPWRLPFTKKKNRNGDEELGKDELPYVVEPRRDTSVDDIGYHREGRMSEAYMSAVNVIDPELAKEEMRRSRQSQNVDYSRSHGSTPNLDSFGQPSDHSAYYGPHRHSAATDYYQQQHYGSQLNVPTPPPHGGHWTGTPASTSQEQLYNESPNPGAYSSHYESADAYHAEEYSSEYQGHAHAGYDAQYVQRPPPSHAHSPPEVTGHPAGYFPNTAYDRADYERQYQSTEQLVEGRRQYPNA